MVELSNSRRVSLLITLLALGLLVVAALVYSRPNVLPAPGCEDVGVWSIIVGGRDMDATVNKIWRCSMDYREQNEVWTIATFSTLFTLLQAFAISGPMVLCYLAGAMWGSLFAQLVVNACSVLGMSLCYLLSATIAKPLVEIYMSRRIEQLRAQVLVWRGDGKSDSALGTFFLVLFLRMTPFVPNWFVNLASPVLGFGFPAFITASALGVIPANYVHCNTGRMLVDLALGESRGSWMPYIILFALQFVAVIPVLLKGRIAGAMGSRPHEGTAGGVMPLDPPPVATQGTASTLDPPPVATHCTSSTLKPDTAPSASEGATGTPIIERAAMGSSPRVRRRGDGLRALA